MDNILLLLSLFAVVKSLFMTSLLPNRWYRLAFSLSLGAFIMLCHPYAMEVNKLELQRVLSTQSAMMNISLVVMVDMLLSGYFCMARIKDWEEGNSFRWYTKLFRYRPSLLVFPALYYIHITLFFTLTGVDFMRTSIGLAVGVTVAFSLASFFMRKLIAEKELLIELVVILTFFVCVLVICCTIFHPSATVYNHASPVDWVGCAGTLALLLVIFILGYLWTQVVRIYKQHKNSKH